jgi:transposase-like protein
MATKKLDLRNPIFNDENAAREHLETVLWPRGPVCPRCGVMGDRITKLQGKSTRPGVYKCKDCRKPFSVTVGTVMERSHIPLAKWLLATQLMASSKKSMSAHQLHRMLGTNYATAWFVFHRLREAANHMSNGGSAPIGGEGKVVEADESYIGGKARNKAFGPPPKKMAVFTLVEREGEARSRHVADVTALSLREAIVTQANRKSYLMTERHWFMSGWAASSLAMARSIIRLTSMSALADFTIRIRSKVSLPCSNAPFTVNSTMLVRLTFTAILPKPISNTTLAPHLDMTMRNGPLRCCAGQRASACSIDSLIAPRTPKQKARAFLRWRAFRETE